MGRALSEAILINLAFCRRASSDKRRLPVHAFSTKLPKNLDWNPFSQAIREQSATADAGIALAVFNFGSVVLRQAQAFRAKDPDRLVRC